MTVRKHAWKNPEEATPEELLEMVLSQRAWLKAAKKKAAKANEKLDAITLQVWYARMSAHSVMSMFGMYELEGGKLEGWLRRAKLSAATTLKRITDVQQKLTQ